MLSLLLVCCTAVSAVQDQGQAIRPLKPPLTLDEEIARWHKRRAGANTEERLKGFEQRLRMEAQGDFGKLVWRSVGPEFQSGRVIRIQTPLDKPDSIHVAFATGGLWRTEDHGITWTPLFEGQSSFGIGEFALSRDGRTIWVGTGEANSQRTSYPGTGVFKSTDAGRTWTNMGLHDSNHIGKILMSPRDPNTVYVAALGHLYSDNEMRGVFKTSDGGKTWQHVLKIDAQTGVVDLAMDPRNPDVLYASAWDRERRAWDFRDSGRATAVYKSTDGGKSWAKLGGGLPTGQVGRIGLAIAESKPDTVYAFIDNWNPNPEADWEDETTPSKTLTLRRFRYLTEDQFVQVSKPVLQAFVRGYFPLGTDTDELIQKVKDKKLKMDDLFNLMEKRNPDVLRGGRAEQEIYRSDDGGKTWKRTHDYHFGNHGGYYWSKVRVNPKNPDEVFTLGVIALRSRDGGKTWKREALGVHADFHDVWYDPAKPGHLVVGCDGGAYESGDDGKTWRHLNNLAVGQFTTVAVDMKTPYNIYGGLQDNGTKKGPSTYEPGRDPLNAWTTVGGGDGSWVAVDPRDGGDLIYVASQFGAHSALNQKTGERWSARAPDRPGEDELRYNWVSPLIISPHHPDILYLGSQKVHRSFNQGRTWEAISPDLTKNLQPQGDVPFSTIKVIDESPLKFGLVYVGCDDGNVKMTPDMGNTWVDIPTPEPNKWVSRIIASKWDVNTVYCTQSGYRDDEYRPYVWKSTNQGKTWTNIAGNLPAEFVNVIREDPVRRDILYVGTAMGVFVTFDGGSTWEPLNAGMPRNPVHDLVIHPRELDIVAATHGRSVYILSAKPLEMLTAEVRTKDLHVFPLADIPFNAAWSMRRSPNWDATPPEPPKAPGWLWAKAPGKGIIKVKDKDGKVLITKEFEAARGLQPFDFPLLVAPAQKPAIDEKTRRPKSLEEILADPREAERAKYLSVGSYTIDVTVGEKTATIPFKVVEPQSPQGGGGRRGGEDSEGGVG